MSYARLLGGREGLKWSDVVSIRYNRYCHWFVVRTNADQVARVSLMLRGIPDFSRLVLSHVQRTAIDPNALPILESASAFGQKNAVPHT
jgi:hypothetical protein